MMNKYPVIRLVRNEVNRGTNYSVNRGATFATGDFICIPSANDQILPGLFEQSIELLEKYPQAGLCCADVHFVNVNVGTSYRKPPNWLPTPGYLSPIELAEAMRVSSIPHPHIYTTIIRRSVLPPDYVFLSELEWYGDWFPVQVIALRYGCCYIPEPLALLRWLDRGYVYSGLHNPKYYKEVYGRIIKLLASPEYEDIAGLMIRGRCLQFIQLHARTPLLTYRLLRDVEEPNSQVISLFLYITGEYLRERIGPKALSTLWQQGVISPVEAAVRVTKGLIKNLCDRAYARAFHEYDQLRSRIKKGPPTTLKDQSK
jgi:glycosyltransferase involved in cell wall biosynthesis